MIETSGGEAVNAAEPINVPDPCRYVYQREISGASMVHIRINVLLLY